MGEKLSPGLDSPVGRYQSAIKPFYLIDELSLYPELLPVRYPKAGERNSEVRIGVVEIETGETTWLDIGPEPDIYIARLDFANSSDEIWLTRLTALQLGLLISRRQHVAQQHQYDGRRNYLTKCS